MQRRGRGANSRGNNDPIVMLSKKFAWLLRHSAEQVGLTIHSGGYVYVDEVLNLPQFKGTTVNQVNMVVQNDSKKRYELTTEEETGRLKIRACQGHSIEVEGLDLKPITDPLEFPVVVHGTFLRSWDSIKATGLNKMNRNHIHFACGEVEDNTVISGMRNNAQVLIYIDLPLAMNDGHQFFLSSNRVILCPGPLSTKYFKEVCLRNPKKQLDFEKSL